MQTKQTVKEQNQYSFWWFQLKWCRLNYLKMVELDSVNYLLYPCHSHTHANIQYTVDTIALDSYKDVCGFCLWLNAHCARFPAALWVPLAVFLFPMDELCCVVVKSNCFETPCDPTATLSKIESDSTLSILILSLSLTETTLTYPGNIPASPTT